MHVFLPISGNEHPLTVAEDKLFAANMTLQRPDQNEAVISYIHTVNKIISC